MTIGLACNANPERRRIQDAAAFRRVNGENVEELQARDGVLVA